jgi:hypothetical protein
MLNLVRTKEQAQETIKIRAKERAADGGGRPRLLHVVRACRAASSRVFGMTNTPQRSRAIQFCRIYGFGLRRTKFPITEWPALVEKWLGTIGMISQ